MTRSAKGGSTQKPTDLESIARTALAYPGHGASDLLQFIVQPILERRKSNWSEILLEGIRSISTDPRVLKDLQSNEVFASTILQATQIAMRTHQNEKLIALKNAVLNVATGQAPDETQQHMFLQLVDVLSEMHLRILKAFQNPKPPPGMSMGGLLSVLEHNIPSLRGSPELSRQLWKELYQRGLINTEGMNLTMSATGLGEKRTTALGEAFLEFISEG